MIPDLTRGGLHGRAAALNHALATALTLGLVAGCADEPAPAVGAQLLVPDDVQLLWDESFNREGDGLGALIPIDVMVYEGVSGEPLGGAEVTLEASDPATWMLLDEDFVVVEPELAPAADPFACPPLADAGPELLDAAGDLESDAALATAAACGRDPDAGPAFLWDARRDQYFALRLPAMPASGAAGHEAVYALPDLHQIALETDPHGLARVYLYVDAFPEEGEVDFGAVSVLVSLGTVDALFPGASSRSFGTEQSFDLIPR